jgi:regulator of nonsense transcripts 3
MGASIMAQNNQNMSSRSTPAGLLPISAAATRKTPPKNPTSSSSGPTPRQKLLIRRLPPGLTQAEFDAALGVEWQVGKGKVDYFLFKEGKVSKECVICHSLDQVEAHV